MAFDKKLISYKFEKSQGIFGQKAENKYGDYFKLWEIVGYMCKIKLNMGGIYCDKVVCGYIISPLIQSNIVDKN